MKCFKKKLATSLLVVSVVCGLSSGAFAETKREVLREVDNMSFVKYTMENGDYCYLYKTVSNGDSMRHVSDSGVAVAMQCFQKQINQEVVKNKK